MNVIVHYKYSTIKMIHIESQAIIDQLDEESAMKWSVHASYAAIMLIIRLFVSE